MKMQHIQISPYPLIFKQASGTSRGVLKTKASYFIRFDNNEEVRYGEVSFIPGLNLRSEKETLAKFDTIAKEVNAGNLNIQSVKVPDYPALQFGFDMLNYSIPKSDFYDGKTGIPINGLIWMGSVDFMQKQLEQKIAQGFSVIKMKIGAIKWDEEWALLKKLRAQNPAEKIEIRVDANGAFNEKNIETVLDQLATLQIHSIEQPVKQGQWKLMRKLCNNSPIPIALDEELISIIHSSAKAEMLDFIHPQYLILKPGLMGGITSCDEWIRLAKEKQIGYWVTSALESNIGLNAIAHWTQSQNPSIPQGLGTGSLYTNNIPSPLKIRGEKLFHNPKLHWDFSSIIL